MFIRTICILILTLILAVSRQACAGDYEMGAKSQDHGGGITIDVTAFVSGEEDVFYSDSCLTETPREECVIITADMQAEMEEAWIARSNRIILR